jgi:hypothetical protein
MGVATTTGAGVEEGVEEVAGAVAAGRAAIEGEGAVAEAVGALTHALSTAATKPANAGTAKTHFMAA